MPSSDAGKVKVGSAVSTAANTHNSYDTVRPDTRETSERRQRILRETLNPRLRLTAIAATCALCAVNPPKVALLCAAVGGGVLLIYNGVLACSLWYEERKATAAEDSEAEEDFSDQHTGEKTGADTSSLNNTIVWTGRTGELVLEQDMDGEPGTSHRVPNSSAGATHATGSHTA